MKVLWLCNTIIPGIRKKLGMSAGYEGGWLEQTYEELIKNTHNQYAYCAPMTHVKRWSCTNYKNSIFYGVEKRKTKPHLYEKKLESYFKEILDDFKPDIIHIFGTENPHSLSMVRICDEYNKIVVHIQGLAFIWGGVIGLIFLLQYFMVGP